MREAPIEEQRELGLLPGQDGEWLNIAFDPAGVDETVETRAAWIRETPLGIEMRRHPEAALRDDPLLWRTLTQWQTGLWRKDLRFEEFERLSNFEVDLILVAQQAHSREVDRRAANRPPPEGEA